MCTKVKNTALQYYSKSTSKSQLHSTNLSQVLLYLDTVYILSQRQQQVKEKSSEWHFANLEIRIY